jgi:hypothetical protein
MTRAEVAELIDGAHTWTCVNGHDSVTWENPPPAEGDLRTCGECGHPHLEPVRIVAVRPGLPLALVRDCLGRKVAAAVLAAGGAS